MGVTLLSRRARGPVRSVGIDPAKERGRDAREAPSSPVQTERAT